jgi:glutaredoxin
MEDVLARLLLVAAILAVVGVAGWWWRRRDGRIRTAETSGDAPLAFDEAQLAEVGLSIDGASAGALLLSSPTCGSCVQVQRILTEVADRRPDFAWVTVDAGEHLDLARRHHVLRVPTLFVLDRDGHLLARTSGIPARHELEQLLEDTAGQRAR